jgi:DnaJ-class molecular chaperone
METKVTDIKVMFDPEKYGYEVCPHCNGYGSSLKEYSDVCTKCYGRGLIQKGKPTNEDIWDDRNKDH